MTQPGSEQPRRLSIKKYPNRRYYDATRSRHVTFEEIYSLIREGYEVEVTDSRTGEDITAKVLAQIIIEMDPLKLGVFPVPLLHGLLRSNEQGLTDFARRYFGQMFASFVDSQRNFGQYLQQMMGLRQPPAVADWARLMWGPLGQPAAPVPESGSAPVAVPPAQPSNGSSTAAPAGRDENEELRRQVEALRAQVNELRAHVAPLKSGKKRGRRA